MATNYLGPVYLTSKLLSLIEIGSSEKVPSAVINLSSFGHLMGAIGLSGIGLNSEKKVFLPDDQYCASKLALLHFSNILGRKFQKENWNCVSVAVNPGNLTFPRV
jgi:NAD(P)-dependent dehydrogenase (short-subunit alcohol dehydrogenase family)